MISSMRGDGEVINGNVTSKAGDVNDNDRMTCEAKVTRGDIIFISFYCFRSLFYFPLLFWKYYFISYYYFEILFYFLFYSYYV